MFRRAASDERSINVPIPMVVQSTRSGERLYDIYSRLLHERIVVLGTPIDEQVANTIIAQLLVLDSAAPDHEIKLYINSRGGLVRPGLAIYDTMQMLRSEISTVCIGIAGGVAAMLLAGGTKGKRACLPHATVHMYPEAGGAEGSAGDVEIEIRELLRRQAQTREIFARDTGQPLDRITSDWERDVFLSAEQAAAYGVVDIVMDAEPSIDAFAGAQVEQVQR